MKVPNANRAEVDVRKLREYCLSVEHPTGKHKARVFAAALGITHEHADDLRQLLLVAVAGHEAVPGLSDAFGERFVVDFVVHWQGKQATVRSTWIIERGMDVPRLTSCYVL